MLANHQSQANQCREHQQGAAVPAHPNCLIGDWKATTSISERLPEPSDVCRCSTGLTVDQISRSHCSSKIGAFRQVAALILGGEERGVSAGSRRTPGGVTLFSAVESQRPASIDSAYASQWDLYCSEDIYQYYPALANLDSGVVKRRPNQRHGQSNWSQALRGSPEAGLGEAHPEHQQHYAEHHPADYLAEPRSEDLHLDNDSLTRGVFA